MLIVFCVEIPSEEGASLGWGIKLQDNHYPTQFFQQGKPQQKTNKKPNPSIAKRIERARVVIPYIKGLSEQYRHTLEKYRVRVCCMIV